VRSTGRSPRPLVERLRSESSWRTTRRATSRWLHSFSDHLAAGSWRIIRFSQVDGPSSEGQVAVVHESLEPSAAASFIEPKFLGSGAVTRDEPITFITSQSHGTISAQIALPRRSGTWILLDLQSQQVLRWRTSGFDDKYVELRRRFADHVPSADFRPLLEASAIVESFAGERMLIRENELVIKESVERIHSGLTSLSLSHEAVSASDRSGQDWLLGVIRSGVDDLRVSAHRADLMSWLGPAPLIPSHGDLGLNNIMIRNGAPSCIDFDRITLRPAWFDASQLYFRCIRSQSGVLDEIEESVGRHLAATVPTAMPSDWRVLLVIVGFAVGMVKDAEFDALLLRAGTPRGW